MMRRILAGTFLLAGCAGYEMGVPVGRGGSPYDDAPDLRHSTVVRGPGSADAGNVWVDLDLLEEEAVDRFETLWSLSAVAEGGARLRRNGLRVVPVRTEAQGELRTRVDRLRVSGRTRAGLLVAPGHEASLAVGESVPGPVTCIVRTDTGESRTFAWREAGLRFSVRADLLDSRRLRLLLVPKVETSQGEGASFTELATTLEVDEGQTVLIGSFREEQETLGAAFFGVLREGRRRERLLLVTPWIR